ncbi:hypothetical protein PsYK624_066760 [Phanerochaete sordida]|uniref:DUF6534 domain-containing protein n=1 Tax=Phanerochaete sordida TaxID=48140 RepID=A0A9P3LCS9_9APHY|nr:hypothetical protein PsYK624_066760 [Phanerochaete sordida]
MAEVPKISPHPYLGPFLIGTVACAILFGILSVQGHRYVRVSNELHKSRINRILVIIIWLLNALNLFAATWSCYVFMISHFGDLTGGILGRLPWSPIAMFACTALSNSLVQGWFVWRIWVFSKRNLLLTAALAFGVVTTCCLFLAIAGKSGAVGAFLKLQSVNWLFYMAIAFDACTNFGITMALSLYMSRKRRSPLYRWDYLISAPVIYMSNLGIFCLIEIFVSLIIRICRPNDLIFFGVFIPYSTMYATALLGFLNAGLISGEADSQKRVALQHLHHHTSSSTDYAIHADMQRAMDDGGDSQVTAELPLTVRVETVVEKEKRKTVL